MQGIINCKGTETFAEEPKLAKLLQGLKPTLVSCNKKKVHWFLSHVCNNKFAAFWGLFCEITCKWVLFPTIDLYFYQLTQIVGKYIIDSLPCAQSRQRQKFNVLVFHLAKTALSSGFFVSHRLFCSRALKLIGQFSVQNDYHRRHTSNTNSYST